MHKPNLAKIVNSAKSVISEHTPEILTGFGIAGMITTTVLAVGATPKALKSLSEREEEDLTPIEVVKTCWKHYIPAAVTGVASTACLVGACSVNARRKAALAAAYKLSETALAEYREQVIDTIGEKKEQVVRDKVAKKRLDDNPVGKNEVIVTGHGQTKCYDHLSGRYFLSDIDRIKRATNELNRRMILDTYVSLNDFYDEIGLSRIRLGDELGWVVDKGLIDIDYSSQLDENGEPALVIDYRVAPRRGYDRFA